MATATVPGAAAVTSDPRRSTAIVEFAIEALEEEQDRLHALATAIYDRLLAAAPEDSDPTTLRLAEILEEKVGAARELRAACTLLGVQPLQARERRHA